MYHTQEKHKERIEFPVLCTRRDAWLGAGYYFWNDEEFAIAWGHASKRKTGEFEIYRARIDCTNFLDTVFNEKHYREWVEVVEEIAISIKDRTGENATIAEVNQFIKEMTNWKEEIDGILFDDKPISKNSLIEKLPYKKRIQAVVFQPVVISNFSFYLEKRCIKR